MWRFTVYSRVLHNSPTKPGLHPAEHVPFTLKHSFWSLQCPHDSLQLSYKYIIALVNNTVKPAYSNTYVIRPTLLSDVDSNDFLTASLFYFFLALCNRNNRVF